MKLVHGNWDFAIECQEGKINQLIIESPDLMAELIIELNNQINGSDGNFVLSENQSELKLSSALDLVMDPFSADVNNRRVLNKLYKEIRELAYDGEQYLKTRETIGGIMTLIEELSDSINVPVIYDDEVDFEAILKAVNLKIDIELESLIDRIIEYSRAMVEYCNVKLIVFINIKTFISNNNLIKLYEFWNYNKINVLLMEGNSNSLGELENTWIIDKDQCVLHS